MVNLLEKLNYTRTTLIQGKDTEDREEGKRMFLMFVSNVKIIFSHAIDVADCFI